MNRVVATLSFSLLLLGTVLAGTAAADPLPQPVYTVQCGNSTYTVVSAPAAAAGSDVNSTREFILVKGNVPERLLTFCTATPVAGGESISGFFLITPAGQ